MTTSITTPLPSPIYPPRSLSLSLSRAFTDKARGPQIPFETMLEDIVEQVEKRSPDAEEGTYKLEELKEVLKTYPAQSTPRKKDPVVHDPQKDWISVLKERGLYTPRVASSFPVRTPLLQTGEDGLKIIPTERRAGKGRTHCKHLRNDDRMVPGALFVKGCAPVLIQIQPRFIQSLNDTVHYTSQSYWLDFGDGKMVRVRPCPLQFAVNDTKRAFQANFVAIDPPEPPKEQTFTDKYPTFKSQINVMWRKAAGVPEGPPKLPRKRHPKIPSKDQRNPHTRAISFAPEGVPFPKEILIPAELDGHVVNLDKLLSVQGSGAVERCGE